MYVCNLMYKNITYYLYSTVVVYGGNGMNSIKSDVGIYCYFYFIFIMR